MASYPKPRPSSTRRRFAAPSDTHFGLRLLCASRKGGELTAAGMGERAITDRVRAFGEHIGVAGLSAHDLQHAWATRAARNRPLTIANTNGARQHECKQ